MGNGYSKTMHRMSRQGNYDSYLLRLWRANPQAPWQASLQSTDTGEIRQFGDVESLLAFVRARLDVSSVPPPSEEVD